MIDTSTMEQQSQVAGKTLNVLLVDDNPTDLKLAMIYLGKAWPFSSDMAVTTAADGLEALERMRTKRFCLIILDWCLPQGGNGHVLREIRRNGVFIPVVVMSGLARDQLPDYLESAGAAYVNKDNLNASTLYCAIAEALRNCQSLHRSASLLENAAGPVVFHSHDPLVTHR